MKSVGEKFTNFCKTAIEKHLYCIFRGSQLIHKGSIKLMAEVDTAFACVTQAQTTLILGVINAVFPIRGKTLKPECWEAEKKKLGKPRIFLF